MFDVIFFKHNILANCILQRAIFKLALSTRKKKKPRNTINSKILKIRKRKRDFDEVYNDYHGKPVLPYDADKKGCGQFKCYACDIYFINDDAMKQHEKTKKHRRRVKLMTKETPYTYKDALRAAEITF